MAFGVACSGGWVGAVCSSQQHHGPGDDVSRGLNSSQQPMARSRWRPGTQQQPAIGGAMECSKEWRCDEREQKCNGWKCGSGDTMEGSVGASERRRDGRERGSKRETARWKGAWEQARDGAMEGRVGASERRRDGSEWQPRTGCLGACGQSAIYVRVCFSLLCWPLLGIGLGGWAKTQISGLTLVVFRLKLD
jgi:hypothetical protein